MEWEGRSKLARATTVVSLGLVRVTRGGNWRCHPYFSPPKTLATFFSHRHKVMTFFSCCLVTTPLHNSHLPTCCPVFFVNSATKKIPFHSGVAPPTPFPAWCHPGQSTEQPFTQSVTSYYKVTEDTSPQFNSSYTILCDILHRINAMHNE